MLVVIITSLIITNKERINFHKIKLFIGGFIVLLFAITIAKYFQPAEDFDSYKRKFTSAYLFKNYAIRDAEQISSRGFGRIGGVLFSVDNIINSQVSNFLFGHGPGSFSYFGYTSGYTNEIFEKYGYRKPPVLFASYIYELGIFGLFLPIIIFIKLYKRWKKTKHTNSSKLFLYQNTPSLLAIYFCGLFYTAVFSNYFLVIFFSINMSYLRVLSRDSSVRHEEPEPC